MPGRGWPGRRSESPVQRRRRFLEWIDTPRFQECAMLSWQFQETPGKRRATQAPAPHGLAPLPPVSIFPSRPRPLRPRRPGRHTGVLQGHCRHGTYFLESRAASRYREARAPPGPTPAPGAGGPRGGAGRPPAAPPGRQLLTKQALHRRRTAVAHQAAAAAGGQPVREHQVQQRWRRQGRGPGAARRRDLLPAERWGGRGGAGRSGAVP